MAREKILVVDDEKDIRELVSYNLTKNGYRAECVGSGEDALARVRQAPPDLVILDLMLPGADGFDVCRRLKSEPQTAVIPVLMLTAKSDEVDVVTGLELGADDYVTKPFGIHELLARVSAALRRAGLAQRTSGEKGADAAENFRIGSVQVDVRRYCLVFKKAECPITDRERHLLRYFHDHPDAVLSRDELLNAVWGVDYFGTTRTLDQHIAQLRKKLEGIGADAAVIQTVHGVGYRMKT